MPNYAGSDCPICGKLFESGDDIVVCPICGSPHHRECYRAVGHCGNDDYHRENRQWEAPVPAPGEAQEVQDRRACGHCGADNPVGNCFCQTCGQRLSPDTQQGQTSGPQNGGYMGNPFNAYMQQAQLDFSQVLDEGVTVKDACDYVGPNGIPFVLRFKLLLGGGMTFNWCAFFFGFFYCFYRKMYKLGAVLLAIFLVMLVPSGYFSAVALKEILEVSGGVLSLPLTFVTDGAGYQGLLLVSMISRMVSIGTMLFCGFFFNRAYYRGMLGRLRTVRENGRFSPGTQEYSGAVRGVGGVNRGSVLALAGGLFALYLVFGYVASFLILK